MSTPWPCAVGRKLTRQDSDPDWERCRERGTELLIVGASTEHPQGLRLHLCPRHMELLEATGAVHAVDPKSN